jgi:cytochrome c1
MPENSNGTGTHHLAVAGAPTRFKPGQSGNPGGRPKGAAKAFREAMPDPTLAARGLLELAQDPDVRPADRISAWNSLLDRGYGKAASFAAIEGADPLEQDEVAAEIRSIAAQLEADRAA